MADVLQQGPGIYATAGAALSGHRAIAVAAGVAVYADNATPAHAGLTRGISAGAASMGGQVTVQTYGPMEEPSWTWTPDAPIFVGLAGALTQTRPTSGFVLEIATALSATMIFIDPKPPIVLA